MKTKKLKQVAPLARTTGSAPLHGVTMLIITNSRPEKNVSGAVLGAQLTDGKQRGRSAESAGRIGRRQAIDVAIDAFALCRRVPGLGGERRNACFLKNAVCMD